WCAALTVGYKNGRPKRKHYYGETRAAVHERLSKAISDLQQGIHPADDRTRLGPYLDHWLENSVKPAVRPKTYESYKQLVRLYLKTDLGHIRLSKLTPNDVRKFMRTRMEGESSLSARTVLYCRAVLRRSLRQAVADGLVSRNVASLADPPHYRRPDVKVL